MISLLKKQFSLRSFLYLGLLLTPFSMLQAQSFVSVSGAPVFDKFENNSSLPIFLNNLYEVCIGVAVVLAVLQLIRAGIMYSVGDVGFAKIEEAKHLILVSLLGLLLVLSPYIVFSIINPAILTLDINTSNLAVRNEQPTGTSTAPTPTESGEVEEIKVNTPTLKLAYFTDINKATSFLSTECADSDGADWSTNGPSIYTGTKVYQVTCGLIIRPLVWALYYKEPEKPGSIAVNNYLLWDQNAASKLGQSEYVAEHVGWHTEFVKSCVDSGGKPVVARPAEFKEKILVYPSGLSERPGCESEDGAGNSVDVTTPNLADPYIHVRCNDAEWYCTLK